MLVKQYSVAVGRFFSVVMCHACLVNYLVRSIGLRDMYVLIFVSLYSPSEEDVVLIEAFEVVRFSNCMRKLVFEFG